MTLGGRFADMNMKIKPSKFYFMGNSVVESRAAGSRQAVVQRYVDILTDAGLKAVFGDQRNKDVLIDILNVILPPHRKVYDIPPVYFIGLLDKDLQDMQRYSPEDSIISEYTFREKTTMKVPDETIFTILVAEL